MKKYVIALDQGTTSSRAMLIDRAGRPVASVQRPFPQIYPQPGWVEHDPQDILSSQLGALTELIMSSNVDTAEIDSIGITNQRETTIVWDRRHRRAHHERHRLAVPPHGAHGGGHRERPGDRGRDHRAHGPRARAYFSASKLAWILGEVPGARARAEAGELCFGTVDSWLIWKLTDGAVHATDVTNASRTMLYNIHERRWDPFLLKLFGIPEAILPEVRPSSGNFGVTANPGLVQGVPICGVAGDQQAALFGQCCFHAGQAKNTYGTGCFLLMHTGHEACASEHGLVTTVAASAPNAGDTEYALEGSVFMAGALIQWLRDELGIIDSVADTDAIARSVATTDGVFVVPAFTGLGAPWWDADARGAILGLTRGAGRAHIVRAALESIAYQVCDLARAMAEDARMPLSVLNVDGGAAANDFLMQFQADMLGAPLRRPDNAETTALGAAYLAGLSTGFWKSTEELAALREGEDRFLPTFDEPMRAARLAAWHEAVSRVRS